ncbi:MULTISPECIES: peptidoglycan editing factor PgeF [unclassified Methylophaga]|jgi:YfiH family protein|uniref:peptidoglycan editing factor PgeF n=1 Tax=unclassified Methylophaga TaxID=2629249 RepID=UPI000C8EEEC4|nr:MULTISPECIES: peptidoglycan editing factor PgeF [unclassified Methylophaga]MAK67374.1 multi-copper polyphenol oxidoreductase [Methylophaga sp.]MAY16913.1 multi-copper polyphenol oxidoreductase [Methylophaga sp.]MBN46572.1 multi-copper polyphenol oxidoreductase [Methylophaga sp.]HAO25204.1 peptidoglycan editing factor PgeF [Methylophaga sp.]HCD05956.1 peptidoglycan editing factor PgeF [Methylophaga sp.]|tara:strand:+ start:95900 stop:96640 length:741 start_codon:yes stop_codon:yes gene_type:complete
MADSVLTVNWPAPKHIKAITTTRNGGQSRAPFDSLNLGDHVGDEPALVIANRQRLIQSASLPATPLWLKQTHSSNVIEANQWQVNVEADAIFCDSANTVCAIMTADCLPVLMTDKSGSQVAAIHAGWRGLQAGIIENTLAQFNMPLSEIIVWLGPAIGPQAFEVGPEVKSAFMASDGNAESAFTATHSDRFLADIYLLARQRLSAQGVTAIYGGDYCTYSEKDRFFSFRRDGVTGRMASLIWIAAE